MASTAAAEIIGANKDLAVEILPHLPAKSLIRFKSVSKAWLSLISTPYFSLLWQSHHHPKVSGLFLNPRSQAETIQYVPLTHSDDLRNQCDIATLLMVEKKTINHSIRSSQLVTEPGFQAKHGNPNLIQIHIYSSETNDWRRSPLDDHIGDFHPTPKSLNEGVYCNGSIHWLSYPKEKTSSYFDVNQERFCPMPTPPSAGFEFLHHFGESGGHLHVINYYMGFNVNVWEMESDYSKWTTKYQVCLNMTTMVVDLALVMREDTTLSLIHNEDEGDVSLVLVARIEMNYMIISYNIKENTFKKWVVPVTSLTLLSIVILRHSFLFD
ncbi:F-box protein At5g07610-like [Cornus florida]|uniref:F-box protein At5g07610-like n=1 Tax=Cornus florida TaxID=4283 RepID=UPI00289CC5AD|nr:F-box protein At5g07610-like [Cornus florida]